MGFRTTTLLRAAGRRKPKPPNITTNGASEAPPCGYLLWSMGKLHAHSWPRNAPPGQTYDFFIHITRVFPPLPFPGVMLFRGEDPPRPEGGSSPRNSMTPGNGRGGWFGEKNQNSARRRGWPLYGADTHRARTPRLHRHAHRRTPRQCRETAHTSPRLVWSWNCPRRSPTRPRRSPTQPRRLPYLPWATGEVG